MDRFEALEIEGVEPKSDTLDESLKPSCFGSYAGTSCEHIAPAPSYPSYLHVCQYASLCCTASLDIPAFAKPAHTTLVNTSELNVTTPPNIEVPGPSPISLGDTPRDEIEPQQFFEDVEDFNSDYRATQQVAVVIPQLDESLKPSCFGHDKEFIEHNGANIKCPWECVWSKACHKLSREHPRNDITLPDSISLEELEASSEEQEVHRTVQTHCVDCPLYGTDYDENDPSCLECGVSQPCNFHTNPPRDVQSETRAELDGHRSLVSYGIVKWLFIYTGATAILAIVLSFLLRG